jgi:hypothetical protein
MRQPEISGMLQAHSPRTPNIVVQNGKFGQLSRVAHRNTFMMLSIFVQAEPECSLKRIFDVVHV